MSTRLKRSTANPFWVCGVTAAHRIFTPRDESSNLSRPTYDSLGFRSTGRTPDSDSGNGSSTLSTRTAADCSTCESTVSRAIAHSGTTATRCGRGVTTEYRRHARRSHASRCHSCVDGLRARLKPGRFWFDSRGWHVRAWRLLVTLRRGIASVLQCRAAGSYPAACWFKSNRGHECGRGQCACSSAAERRPDVPEIAGSIPAARTTSCSSSWPRNPGSQSTNTGPIPVHDTRFRRLRLLTDQDLRLRISGWGFKSSRSHGCPRS